MSGSIRLRKDFPLHNEFKKFLEEYRECYTYWYIPKAMSLREKQQAANRISNSLEIIFNGFLGEKWNRDTQDSLLSKMRDEELVDPYKDGIKQDRTALMRILIRLLGTLGLLWIEENNEIIITDAGLDLLSSSDSNQIELIEGQIAKYQYPNPDITNQKGFDGILPHLFLLQALQKLDYKISHVEYNVFINLAKSQNDLDHIVSYVKNWRELDKNQQKEIYKIIKSIPMQNEPTDQMSLFQNQNDSKNQRSKRYKIISQDSSYQRAFYCFPYYLIDDEKEIYCESKNEIDTLIKDRLNDLKISTFRNRADWFAYYGNPEQKPSWFNYLSLAVEHAASKQEAERIIEESGQELNEQDAAEIKKKQIEKGIEDFYVDRLSMIEDGLTLFDDGEKKGRQFSTPIGLVDLLCRDKDGKYVVIEIKAEEAKDSVFGQILRYMGWIHRNIDEAHDNVRGIIMASDFSDKARYSRIGLELLNNDFEKFMQFRKHGLNLQNT